MSSVEPSSAPSSASDSGSVGGAAPSTSTSSVPPRPALPPMPRYSTRVRGAPSKLLDELIATPLVKKRRGGSAGRPPKKPKMTMGIPGVGMGMGLEGMDPRYYAMPEHQRRQMQFMQAHPAFRMLAPGINIPGSNPFLGVGYPGAIAAAAALSPPGAQPPATFRPGLIPATATVTPAGIAAAAPASHVHAHAYPAVPVAPHATASMAHELDGDYLEEGHAEENSRSSGELVTLLASTRCCALTPASFFVAWHGVLTLSFAGFPSPLSALKTELGALESAWALPLEQPGSKWPKLTLACLREGRQLTADQLRQLYEITARMKEQVRNDPWRMPVRELSYVKFASRSCERLLIRTDVPLKDSIVGGRAAVAAAAAAVAAGRPNVSVISQGLPVDIPAEESAKVNSVLVELRDDTVDAYLVHVNKPGGRVQHYQSAHSESSLVAFACPSRPQQAALSRAPAFLEEFRQQVDQLLPDYYEWFPWSSLHCTIRSMA